VIVKFACTEGTCFLDEMNGILVLQFDVDKDEYFVARDHMGIIPLYIGWDQHGTFYVASRLKNVGRLCTKIQLFPQGII
jgi:asparagine synthase (glutamine-hydrolysing)